MFDRIINKKVYITIALVDAFATQIYIDLFSNNFRISVAVLLLPIIYFFNRRINPIITSLYIGLIGMLIRTVIGMNEFGSVFASLMSDYQILFFDLTYGLIFYFFLYKKKDYDLTRWILVVLLADMMANIAELFVRTAYVNLSVFSDQIYILFYVAIFRTFIALIVVLVIKSYKMFLLKTEHNERYQKLLLRISDLESELYFINRNMEHIEGVMFNSYDLYDHVDSLEKEDIKQRALGISRDIHEIKKNYVNIYYGIKEITDKDKDVSELKMFDLMNILFKSLIIQANDANVSLKYHINSNFVVKESYYFITIIRNIVVNAIEELISMSETNKSINLYEVSTVEYYIYKIVDNGPGVNESDMKEIFNAGFSTKFHDESGDSNRGLGLFIVKELIETMYNGEISIESERDVKTEFTIKIPKKQLEVIE